ncbi:MAG: carboxypeptidase-like regulatory domain-containing protein [Planctomycetota bacterium]
MTGTVKGTVSEAGGLVAVSGASVWVNGIPGSTVTSDASGAYTLTGVAMGSQTIRATHTGGDGETDVVVTAGGTASGVDIELIPVVMKGNRLLGINPHPSVDGDDASAFDICLSAGVNAVTTGFSWSELEVDPGVFDYTEIDIINSIYATGNVKVILMLNPIETDWKSVPTHLESVAFDNSLMIDSFNMFLDNVFARLPSLDIDTLLIGNEVNGYIGDYDKWDEYRIFYEAVGAYARILRPGMKIGVETMFEGMISVYPDKIKTLNQSSDVLAITYYPDIEIAGHISFPEISVIKDDFTALAATYPGEQIYIIEMGYSSSHLLNSSEIEQEKFIREAFRVWDNHVSQFEFISFFMLHDYSAEYIDPLLEALGITEHPNYAEIRESFITLGLRTCSGQDKLAFPELILEAEKRGW